MTIISRPAPTDFAYSSAVDGGAHVAVRMQIEGQFDARYLDFVAERAGWLSLSGWAESDEAGRALVVAAGPEALVGALEMACVLGPLDTLIETLETEDETRPIASGFTVRR